MTTMIILIIMCVVLSIYWFYKNRQIKMTLLKRNNIPGPEPHLLLGNMIQFNSIPNVVWDSQLIEKYGPICGYYIGSKPVILIKDPDLIKEVQEKNSRNFLARPRRVPGGINPDPLRSKMLGNIPVNEWKDLRKILSPSFKPSRMKSMTATLTDLIEELMRQLASSCQDELDVYPKFQNFTLDLIGRTGFGVDLNFQGKHENSKLKAAIEKEFSKNPDSYLAKSCLIFPDLWVLQRVRIIFQMLRNSFSRTDSQHGLKNVCWKALEIRKDSGEKRHDILQTMLDSSLATDDPKIVANSILFFEAAFETLSAGLAFTVNLLMNHIGIQEKVRNEILTVLKENNGQLSADSVKSMKYLDAVIKEALRIYPPQTTFISRSGETDFVYERDGKMICTIPKNTQIQIALNQIQNSPDFWDEPEMFKPERHLDDAEKHPMYATVWQPFGKGHRKCIGYSYAKLVLPMVLATILSKFRLSPSSKTEKKITLLYKTATMTPKNGCFGKITFDPLI